MNVFNSENIELIQQIVILMAGVIALILKVRASISLKNRKLDLKHDIEILDLLKKQGNIDINHIEDKVKSDLVYLYDKSSINENGLTTFFIGVTIFVGFGLWSLNIYNNNLGFSGWIILTMVMSGVGLSMILMESPKVRKTQPFLVFGFFDRPNMVIGFNIMLISGIILFMLIMKLKSFSFWEFLSGLFFILGIFTVIRNIKIIK
jgi:hypothetical protein